MNWKEKTTNKHNQKPGLVQGICYLKYIAYFIYTSTVLYLVFWGGNDFRHTDIFTMRNYVNLIPAKDKIADFASGQMWTYRFFYQFLKDLVGNILLLFPLSFFLVLNRFKIKTAILIAATVSFAIELTQYTFGIGIADIDDFILNVIGAVVGAGVAERLKKQNYWTSLQRYLAFS